MKENLTLEKRLNAFAKLGAWIRDGDAGLETLILNSENYNGWFTPANTRKALESISEMLQPNALSAWSKQWGDFTTEQEPKKIGLILAGNIPLVGFHDVLAVLVAGHEVLIKLSSQDPKLLPYILTKLVQIEPQFAGRITYVERLENFDAVIATGSNNSARYFEYYFGKVPHIIRKNRNSIAILTGTETKEELAALGADIFDYFGLGCRNVSKIFVPKGYTFDSFFQAIEPYQSIAQHHKYLNNYDYNKSIYLVNGDQHLDNGFLLLKPDEKIASPLAVVYYEEYDDTSDLRAKLLENTASIQCIASKIPLDVPNQVVSFGDTQKPQLWDYADGINTMQFLLQKLGKIQGK